MTKSISAISRPNLGRYARAGYKFNPTEPTLVDLERTDAERLVAILEDTKLAVTVPETIDGDTQKADAMRDAARSLHELAHFIEREMPGALTAPPHALLERGTAATLDARGQKVAEFRSARGTFVAAHAAWKEAS